MESKPSERPADKAIRLLGVKEIAFACNLTSEAVRKWPQRGGLIPSEHQGAVLALAERAGKPLAAPDLIGAPA